MRWILRSAVMVFLFLPVWAHGWPNEGAVLVAHDLNLTVTGTGLPDCASDPGPLTCGRLDTEVDTEGPEAWAAFRVYLVFPETTVPHMCLGGAAWGIHYDPDKLVIVGHQACSDQEYPDSGWPQTGTGISVTWSAPQVARVVPVYTFAAYTQGEAGGHASLFELGPNPDPLTGGILGENCLPIGLIDPIIAYGKLGFHTPGYGPCYGACCSPGGVCRVSLESGCAAPGTWLSGEIWSCAPDPCGAVPVRTMSWGRIKSLYH
jgi:hypothetical protein